MCHYFSLHPYHMHQMEWPAEIGLQLLSYLHQVVKTQHMKNFCFLRDSAHLDRQQWLDQLLGYLDRTDTQLLLIIELFLPQEWLVVILSSSHLIWKYHLHWFVLLNSSLPPHPWHVGLSFVHLMTPYFLQLYQLLDKDVLLHHLSLPW